MILKNDKPTNVKSRKFLKTFKIVKKDISELKKNKKIDIRKMFLRFY